MTPLRDGELERQARRRRVLDALRLVFSAAAIGLVVLGLFTLRERSRSRGWERTPGRVVSSSVNDFVAKDGAHTYRPMVVFSYSVGALRLMSNRLSFRSLSTSNRGDVETLIARYPAGKHVQVYYDPQEPDRAVLERGGNPWLPLLAGGACSFAAVAVRILRGRAERRDDRRA